MTIEVRGHTFSAATFVFVCDNCLYYSYNGKGWTNVIDQYGYSAYGYYQHGCRTRRVSCSSKRDSELNSAFRAALHRATGVYTRDMDAYIQKQIDAKNQVLVEGTSVRIASSSSTLRCSQTKTPAAPAAPVTVPRKERGKRVPVEGPMMATKPAMAQMYLKYGLTEDLLDEFHAWYRKHTGQFKGVKLKDVIRHWLDMQSHPEPVQEPETIHAPIQEAIQEPVVEAAPETTSEATMTVVATRPNQAAFAAAVKDNCFDVCVVTGSAIHARCSAAHLVEHSKNGAAHYTNGLWLRWDIHKMMDDGWCAIDPDTLVMWFHVDALALDFDLTAYHGMPLRETRKPINREFLRDRWASFQKLRNAA
ncbi:HNH endonuclease [Salmonella enterica subsp. enterica serovar Enteritidis]|nr:HNH endonuclease [Salmonella enterica subsp. enterica serovar Enteritidis]